MKIEPTEEDTMEFTIASPTRNQKKQFSPPGKVTIRKVKTYILFPYATGSPDWKVGTVGSERQTKKDVSDMSELNEKENTNFEERRTDTLSSVYHSQLDGHGIIQRIRQLSKRYEYITVLVKRENTSKWPKTDRKINPDAYLGKLKGVA